MHLECSAQPAEGAAAMTSRNARSLDTGPSSSREATKAAAWMWHMHLSPSPSPSPSPLSRPATELSDQSTAWEAKRRRSSFDRSDSRFRQEAASMASASDSGPPPDDATTPSKTTQESVGVWDCGSELYDTFELVSFSNSLDRSLVSASASVDGPAANQAQSQAHAPPSPPPSRGSRAGVIRTSSLPINFSAENSVPSAGYGHGSDPRLDVANRSANEADEGRSSSNFDGRPSAYIHSKFSPLHHSLSKVAQIMKKFARTHPQLDCFGSQAATRLRSFMSRRSEDEEDDARMPRTQSALPASGNNDRNFHSGRRRCEAMEDANAAEKEYQCTLPEEKMKWGKCGKHFYHHHHHYHHHFVHYVDQCGQAANERNLGNRMDVIGIR